MNKVDKLLADLSNTGDAGQDYYENKDEWTWFDYLMGYGCPLALLGLVIKIIWVLLS